MIQKYGTPFPAIYTPGNNVWPLKLVTKLFELAKKATPSTSTAPQGIISRLLSITTYFTRSNQPEIAKEDPFSLTLHTHTPVTSVSAIPGPLESPNDSGRRWKLTTPRGDITTSYVLHATNAYASHLLPHLAGEIVPTRGQVIATRPSVPASKLWTCAWGANEGFEYFFPRPVKNPDEERPLILLGGGREASGPKFEFDEADDSKLNEQVGRSLRTFLPAVFPAQFEDGREPEMEWVSGPPSLFFFVSASPDISGSGV